MPKPKTAAQLARSERGRERLRRKHLARVAKVAPKLQAWQNPAQPTIVDWEELNNGWRWAATVDDVDGAGSATSARKGGSSAPDSGTATDGPPSL